MKKGMTVAVYEWKVNPLTVSATIDQDEITGEILDRIFVQIAKINRRDDRKYEWIRRATGLQIAREMYAEETGIDVRELGKYFRFVVEEEKF